MQVAPSRIIVQVSNGGGVSGAGAKAADDLTKLGFVLAGPATNSTLHGVTQTLITYDPRYDVSLKTLQGGVPRRRGEGGQGAGRTFQVIVGSDYQAPKAGGGHGSTATTTTPAAITTTSGRADGLQDVLTRRVRRQPGLWVSLGLTPTGNSRERRISSRAASRCRRRISASR